MRGMPWVFVGVCLAALALAQPLLAYAVNPRWAVGLGATMLAELATGREAAFLLALGAGVPAVWIALTSVLQNLALASLLVPPILLGIGNLERHGGRLGRVLQRMHASAGLQLHQGRSASALFVFMLLPFVANGAVIAGVIGGMAGLAWRRLAFVVAAAVTLTSLAWAYAYAALVEALGGAHPTLRWLPAVASVGILAAWLAWAALKARRDASQGLASP